MFSGVSTNGTSLVQAQLGTSAGIQTTGYLGGSNGNATGANSTTGLLLSQAQSASDIRYGMIVIANISNNSWVMFGSWGISNGAFAGSSGGGVSLSGTLDRVRITTVNGTDTFDAGSINILYEG
jgi:hypothetical protein